MNMKFYCCTLLLLLSSILADAQVIVTKDVDYMNDSVYDNGKDLLDIYMPQDKKKCTCDCVFSWRSSFNGR